MKPKFDLQMTRGQTRLRDEDTVVERYQSLVGNPPNRLLSCLWLCSGEGVSNRAPYGSFA